MTKRCVITITLLLRIALASAVTVAEVTPPSIGVERADLNPAVPACADFYEFANGSWRKHNPIPDTMQRWSRRIAAHEANQQRVQRILDALTQRHDWPRGSVEQVVGDHYASCMNETGVETAGVSPLKTLLGEIDGMRNLTDVNRIVRKLHQLAVPVPFGTGGTPDYHEPAKFIENILAGGLGLPDRDYYLKQDPRSLEVRRRYLTYVAKLLYLSGVSDAQSQGAADNILALETRLAQASLDGAAAADPAATDHVVSFEQLQSLAPHVDWERYFNDARLPRIDLNVAEPRFIEQIDRELTQTPIAIWRAYFKWHLLDSAAPWLSHPFVAESFGFRDQYLGGASQIRPRAQRCAESVDALLGEALGKKYVEQYFPPTAKAKAQQIADNLRSALKDVVEGVQWMEPQTKAEALAKLAATDIQIGYPDQWKDYSTLAIRPDALWANIAEARKFAVEDDRHQIGRPTNRDLWLLAPSSPDAYIDLQLNKLVLPAGFMQPPYFNIDASDAVNYGAFGIALAHDLTHAIDVTGSETDARGRPRNWWSDSDRSNFQARAQCVVDQFDNYFVDSGGHHQGTRVLSEAIGDMGGVRISYLALQKSMTEHPVPVIDGFTPDQQFFISWGQTTGAAMRLEAQKQLIASDPHPVPKFRVIGPLSDSPQFERAFSCIAGDAMLRPPEKRCEIW